MRRPAVALLVAALVAALGCRGSGRGDLLESELRAKDNDLRQLREELEKTAAYNHALQSELNSTRAGACHAEPGADPAASCYPIRTLSLGRGTGGVNDDHEAGDEALQVVVEPRDVDGHVVKAPGCLTVQSLEITTEGLKRPLTTWQVPPEQLRSSWRSGLLSTGYNLTLPWKMWPTVDRVRVVAQLRLPDGRCFEAEKDVTVRLCPANRRPTAPMPPADKMLPPDAVLPPPESPTLPPPNKLEGPILDTTGLWRPVSARRPAPAAILKPVPIE